MNIIKAILFGIVEGITEWMPVSSTAHMKILNTIVTLKVSPEFYDVFEVVIQLGAIAALIIIFWKKIFPFGKSKNPMGPGILSLVKKDKFILWVKIVIACLPAIIYELFLDKILNFVNEKNEMIIIAISLILVGLVFIGVEFYVKDKKPDKVNTRQITYQNALIIGLVQLIAAIFPGVSRSGSTIIASLLLGISRVAAVEFTFELAIPVMAGASLMKVLKYGFHFSFEEVMIMFTGCSFAFIVSFFMIGFVLNYIKKNNFNMFGIYRILLGIIIFMFLV